MEALVADLRDWSPLIDFCDTLDQGVVTWKEGALCLCRFKICPNSDAVLDWDVSGVSCGCPAYDSPRCFVKVRDGDKARPSERDSRHYCLF